MKTSFICWLCFFPLYLTAQLGVGTTVPNSSSILDVASTSKGFLMPQLTTTQMNAISSPAQGLMVYNTDAKAIYHYNGTAWCARENQIAAFVDELDTLQLDHIRVRISNNRSATSLQLATVSGSITIAGNSMNLERTSTGSGAAGISTYIWQSKSLSTTFTHFQSNLDFDMEGSTQLIDILDETNKRFYTIGFVFNSSYSNNFVFIKRKM